MSAREFKRAELYAELATLRIEFHKLARAAEADFQRAEAAESALAREREARDDDVAAIRRLLSMYAPQCQFVDEANARLVAHRKDREEA